MCLLLLKIELLLIGMGCTLQLPGIVRMFASEMTVASAWIHLLAVDLFAARSGTHH